MMRRPLSFHRSENEGDLGPFDPSQSPLFSLPLEIRRQIYQDVLGGKIIHFIRCEDGTLACVVCPFQGHGFHRIYITPESHTLCFCDGLVTPDGLDIQVDKTTASEENRLSLLYTCRQIYIEAIDILTTHNIFNIQAQSEFQFGTLRGLQKAMSQSQFTTIRTLEISFVNDKFNEVQNLSNPAWFQHWSSMCSVLVEMEKLANLHIWINIEQGFGVEVTPEHETRFFAPLLSLGGIRCFLVEVSWPQTAHSVELLQDAPFSLIRRERFNSPWQVLDPIVYEHPSLTHGVVPRKRRWAMRLHSLFTWR
ncbi:hypothetical protein BGW36DRAFT_124829 [Talaromyces proteolyticus]|uniref:DUF7730 domain-containing protein n=1 Tax=Talaromyces proteolyticus TaxID=1131652 RepID=A0AAD4KZM6_9EURO|nr:uncharacterized protein BGW36DRAFT_124829 [Talaromyces proteolyticus]KAH8700199.1 hypothetical protein BGW36DRAFT_124829 [Talaromyces proteolyticus]